MYRKAEISISILLIIIGGLVISVASSFPRLEGTDVGAAYFPRMLSIILIGLAVLLFIKGIKPRVVEPSETETVNIDLRIMIFGIIATIVYTLLVNFIGFYPSTILFLIAMMWMLGFRKILIAIILSIGITLFIYFVFEYFLQVPIPRGTLFE